MGHNLSCARKRVPELWGIISAVQGREFQSCGTPDLLCKEESSRVVGHRIYCARKRVPELWDTGSTVQGKQFQSCGTPDLLCKPDYSIDEGEGEVS